MFLGSTNNEVRTHEIKESFGPKVSKNGYRYNKKVGAKVAKSILELYKHMIGKWKVTNGQINKCFARGVVSWLKHGTKLDWAKYAIYYDKYNVEFIEKDENGEFHSTSTEWCYSCCEAGSMTL
jgi:hypothetical protein